MFSLIQTTDIAMHRRSAAIRGLQFYLRENVSIVKTIQVKPNYIFILALFSNSYLNKET